MRSEADGWINATVTLTAILLVVIFGSISTCDGIDGQEGYRCYPNATCDDDLVCYDFATERPRGVCYPANTGEHVKQRK